VASAIEIVVYVLKGHGFSVPGWTGPPKAGLYRLRKSFF
jgi:hypothetical protein